MKNYKILYCLTLLLLCSSFIFSQQSPDSSYAKAVAVYINMAGANAHLYSGSEYIDFDHRITGNPFFQDTYFTSGSIVYDGILYKDVQLFYDVLHDDVIIKNYDGTAILLPGEKVEAFSLLGHQFVNSKADSNTSSFKSLGFYDELYNGKMKLFAKRSKAIVEKITTQYSESDYTKKDEYYILKNDVLYAVNDKNTVLDLMKDKKSEVVKFMHQSKIKFKKNPEAAMIKMVAYYDSLTNTK